ncbi:MAG: ribosome maturation factor RimP [Actinomycetota bacterium]
MAIEDRVHDVLDPLIDDLGLELVDLVYGGGRLMITIDHPDGLGTELLTKATRLISHEMDLADPISAAYTLEVSSPGVERNLRLPKHYARSIGEIVNLKLKPGDDDLRRIKGTLTAADDDTVTIDVDGEAHQFSYERISKAKTVFDWGPAPKPGKKPANQKG